MKAKASDKQLREIEVLQANHRNRVREAWKQAAEKHGEEYANEIFPIGTPALAS